MSAAGGLPGELRVVDDVAVAFAGVVVEAFAQRPAAPGSRFTLVLSGGPTARRCYEALAAASDGAIDWRLVDVLVGDERCVPADDPDANQRLVREALLDRVGTIGSFRPMDCEAGPTAYQQVLEDIGPPDLIHLGLGPDGHTASLFPGSLALQAPPGVLVTTSTDPTGRNPHRRMTLTFEAIARARLALFTVAGVAKRDALARLAAGEDLPAGRVRARRVLWLVDPDAAGTGRGQHDVGALDDPPVA